MIMLDLKKWVVGIGIDDSVFQLACCCIFIILHHILQRSITESWLCKYLNMLMFGS